MVFKHREGVKSTATKVPCGRCVGCRLETSRQWALRIQKEASLYERNCVVTLTYAKEHLPEDGSINNVDPVLFMKKLREELAPTRIRSFGCAEYGEQRGRPHYHIVLFNCDFDDKVVDRGTQPRDPEHKYWTSATLDRLWGMGRTQIMPLNFETAAYVARYVTKKISGAEHTRVVYRDGKFCPVADERSVCVSRRPGIGKDWWQKHKHTLCNQDSVFERGLAMRPPKYFDRLMEIENPDAYQKVKSKRKREQEKHLDKLKREFLNHNYTNSARLGYRPRMRAEKLCKEAQFLQLKRGYENP